MKLFRRIRQSLMMENKTGKYLKYAIGEIALVMIGILLALQVNNWNQRQQNNELAKLYFEDFISELGSDVFTLTSRIKSNEKIIQNIDSILGTLATKDELSESELPLFAEQHQVIGHESYFLPETSTFRQLESNGAGNLIKDKKLRDGLYQYYMLNERNEKNGEISVQQYQHNFVSRDIFKDIISGDFLLLKIGSTLNRPMLALEDLRQNSDYLLALFMKREMSSSQNSQYQIIKLKAEELLSLLEAKQ